MLDLPAIERPWRSGPRASVSVDGTMAPSGSFDASAIRWSLRPASARRRQRRAPPFWVLFSRLRSTSRHFAQADEMKGRHCFPLLYCGSGSSGVQPTASGAFKPAEAQICRIPLAIDEISGN
jgi:hypothetical protein